MRGIFPLLFFMSNSGEATVYYYGLLPVSGLLLRVPLYLLVKVFNWHDPCKLFRRGHVLEVRALRPALIIKLKKEFNLHSWPPDFCIREDFSYPDRSCYSHLTGFTVKTGLINRTWVDLFKYCSVILVLPCTVIDALVFATPSTFLATHLYRPSSSFFTLSMIRTPSSHRVIPATKRSLSWFALEFRSHVWFALLHTGQVS